LLFGLSAGTVVVLSIAACIALTAAAVSCVRLIERKTPPPAPAAGPH
jgi:hypothetical protein